MKNVNNQMSPLTFESALRWLSDNEGQMFSFYPSDDVNFDFVFGWVNDKLIRKSEYLERFTQDQLDEILSLIGWEYEVWKAEVVTKSLYDEWGTTIWTSSDGKMELFSRVAKTKLLAAKAAFIAAVTCYSKQKEG